MACTNPSFRYHPSCKKHNLIHLMFTDDLMIFCAANVKSVKLLMDAFQSFSTSTGLTANFDKSAMVLRGCKEKIEQDILRITGFQKGTLPFRYLGIPITASRLT